MNEQTDLFECDALISLRRWIGKDSRNKEVYDRFCEIALQGYSRGMKRWSARGVCHVLRWQTAVADSDTTFKINNNMIATMARCAMADHPQLEGFFEVRT